MGFEELESLVNTRNRLDSCIRGLISIPLSYSNDWYGNLPKGYLSQVTLPQVKLNNRNVRMSYSQSENTLDYILYVIKEEKVLLSVCKEQIGDVYRFDFQDGNGMQLPESNELLIAIGHVVTDYSHLIQKQAGIYNVEATQLTA